MSWSSVRIFAVSVLMMAVASTPRAETLAQNYDRSFAIARPGRVPTRARKAIPTGIAARVEPLSAPQDIHFEPRLDVSFQSRYPLLARISSNIEGAGLSYPSDLDNEPRGLTDNRNRTIFRAAKKAFKSFVAEGIDLGSLRPGEPAEHASEPARALQVRVGVSHLAPNVNLRCPVGNGAMSVSLGTRGTVGVDFTAVGVGEARLHLGYDRRSKTSAIAFRMAF